MDGTARGGRGAGHAMPFEAFLERLRVGARARNDTAWLEWHDGWLRNMPEGDGREGYIERSREEYERRMGETVDEYMDPTWKERLAQIAKEGRAESLAERTKKNCAERLAERTKKNCAERLAELNKENLAELNKENLAESLAERTKRHIEEGTDHQIMVENFKIFQREYLGMAARRCA